MSAVTPKLNDLDFDAAADIAVAYQKKAKDNYRVGFYHAAISDLQQAIMWLKPFLKASIAVQLMRELIDDIDDKRR